jgi:ribosomal protein S27E
MEYIDQAEESRRFSELYARMSEVELQSLAQKFSDLTEFAQQALRAEFSKRGLQMQVQAAPESEILPDEDDLVNCYRARDSSAARMVMNILESSGIPSCLFGDFGENLQRLYPVHDTGGMIKVLKRDAERAGELMALYFPREQDKNEDYEVRCPRCHSSEVIFQSVETGISERAISASKFNWTCGGCGNQWKDDEVEQDT